MSDSVADEMVEKVLGSIEDGSVDSKELRLTNGAVVRILPPPTMALQAFRQQHPRPQPPIVHVEQDGRSWDEANPNAPAYLEALKDYAQESGEAMIRLALWTSCEIVRLPKGARSYEEDDTWIEEMEELLGTTVPETCRLRKIAWMRYRVLGNPRDFDAFQDALAALSGTTEEMVKAAEESFRSDT